MADDTGGALNRSPAVERMMGLLTELQKATQGLGLMELAQRTGVTRSSVYRILNSLEAHGMVRQLQTGAYVLGSRLIVLGNTVAVASRNSLPHLLQAELERLTAKIGETAKISVYDRGAVIVIAGSHAKTPHALNFTLGEQLPLHAGGASKVLMANLPPDELAQALGRSLPRLTDKTITDPGELAAELARIRERGWAHDPGEFSLRTHSYAAAVRDSAGDVVAGLSVPFLAGSEAEVNTKIREAVVASAQAMTAILSGLPSIS